MKIPITRTRSSSKSPTPFALSFNPCVATFAKMINAQPAIPRVAYRIRRTSFVEASSSSFFVTGKGMDEEDDEGWPVSTISSSSMFFVLRGVRVVDLERLRVGFSESAFDAEADFRPGVRAARRVTGGVLRFAGVLPRGISLSISSLRSRSTRKSFIATQCQCSFCLSPFHVRKGKTASPSTLYSRTNPRSKRIFPPFPAISPPQIPCFRLLCTKLTKGKNRRGTKVLGFVLHGTNYLRCSF